MSESKRLERELEAPTGPARPCVSAAPENILEALDIHGEGIPKTSERPAAPDHRTPCAAKTEATARDEKTPRSEAVWPVVVEPADGDAVAVWRNEGDPN